MPPLVAAAPPLSRPPRGRPPTPGLRESILRAAEDIFTRRDYHEVQMDELDGIGRLRAELEAAVQTSEPPALKIEHIVRCTLGYFWDRRLFFALIHQHEHKPDKDTHEWFHQREQLVRLVRHAFDQAIAAGHVRRVDSRIATEMLFGMMRGVNRYRVRGDRLEALVTALVDVFMHGVGTPSGRRTLMKRRAKGPE